MDYREIESLLEKYQHGESSLEEEIKLQQLLQDPFLKMKYPQEAAMFQYFNHKKDEELDDDTALGKVMMRVAGRKTESKPSGTYIRKIMYAAAVALLLLLAGTYIFNEQPTNETLQTDIYKTDTYQDPELAYAEAKNAMLLISEMMNAGLEETQKIQSLHEAEEKIKHEM